MYSSSREKLSLTTTLEKTRSWEEPEKLKPLGRIPHPSKPAWLELCLLVAILDGNSIYRRAAPSARLRHGDIFWCRANGPKLCMMLRFGSKLDSGIASFVNRLVNNSCMSRCESALTLDPCKSTNPPAQPHSRNQLCRRKRYGWRRTSQRIPQHV